MCVVSVTLTSCSVRVVKSLCILEYLTCEINFRRKGLIMQFTLQSGIGYSPKKETTGVYHKENKPKFPAYYGSLANKVLKFKPADGW